MRILVVSIAAAIVAGAFLLLVTSGGGDDAGVASRAVAPSLQATAPELPAAAPAAGPLPSSTPPAPEALRWLAVGGGSIPELNQVSIEQDLGLAATVFGDGGSVLFAGGPESPSVQVLERNTRGDALLLELGHIFQPRQGRDSRYRLPTIRVDGPATAPATLEAVRAAAAGGEGPLLLYFAGHGDMAEEPRDNTVALWGGFTLTPAALAEALDGARRGPVRVVVTTCFSGGFAELAFAAADADNGPAASDRCGLFASPWDLEASGCDPDPDRRAHDGFGLHFLQALRGLDRSGRPLPPGQGDLDGDGRITLLEAHAQARIASASIDVPTTTSERWLRHAAPAGGPSAEVALPEEEAVIRALSSRLGFAHDPDLARGELDATQASLEAASSRLDAAQVIEDERFQDVAAALLARWPVLDDPWHPDFQPMFERHREDIRTFLDRSPENAALQVATARTGGASSEHERLRLRAAPLERLVRALENRVLASRLAAAGGPAFTHFQRLRACESTAP